jgi:hypothetical protein
MQVIMIARLHAMNQQSRKMLIFLVVVFLGVQITCGVITAFTDSRGTGGKLWSYMTEVHQAHHATNTRGVDPFRKLSVRLRVRLQTCDIHYLDSWHCMGGPRTVHCSLDYRKTLPWTAATRTIDRVDDRRLFRGFNKDPHVLLCRVSLWF